jgi:hypothetical protein
VRTLLTEKPPPGARPFDHEEALGFLVARGLPEAAVRRGSMPLDSLGFVRDLLVRTLRERGRPLHGLHIGNFVGVSLAAFSSAALEAHSESLVVSIDPNVPHHGIDDPQSHTLALLAHFGLERANLVVTGYTLERTPSVDAWFDSASDPALAWPASRAAEEALPHLERLGAHFDAALLDGCHLGDYARRELEILSRIVLPGGLVFLDDVADRWGELRDLYADRATVALGFERVDYDGRVGVLRRV